MSLLEAALLKTRFEPTACVVSGCTAPCLADETVGPLLPTQAPSTAVLALHFTWLGGLFQGAALVVLKEHFATIDEAKQALIEACEVLDDVAQVALQNLSRLVVARGIHDLR